MFMMVPSAVGMTTSVLVAMPPIARSPESKVTVLLDWLMVPAVVTAETKDTLSGNVSVILTAVDVAVNPPPSGVEDTHGSLGSLQCS